MKSRAISRPVHKTTTGRVVYDRAKHYLTARDALRILKALKDPATLAEFLALRDIAVTLLFQSLAGILKIIGRIDAFALLGLWMVELIRRAWAWLREETSAPADFEPPI
jgi:hypothetical protein